MDAVQINLPCNRKRNEHPDRRPLVSLYVLQSPLRDEAYLRYEKAFERIVSGCPAEDCEDGMEYNEEWEDEEYDPDEV